MRKPKLYNYVGSEEIKLSVINSDRGTVIRSISDIRNWIDNTYDKKTIASNLVVATFVIDMYRDYSIIESVAMSINYDSTKLLNRRSRQNLINPHLKIQSERSPKLKPLFELVARDSPISDLAA
jgi:ssDNA-binding replication factor A large subunit